jgi:hypothetical protein
VSKKDDCKDEVEEGGCCSICSVATSINSINEMGMNEKNKIEIE